MMLNAKVIAKISVVVFEGIIMKRIFSISFVALALFGCAPDSSPGPEQSTCDPVCVKYCSSSCAGDYPCLKDCKHQCDCD